MSLQPLNKNFGIVINSRSSLLEKSIEDRQYCIDNLVPLLLKHKFVLFKKSLLTPNEQLKISRNLGEIESTFYKHPASPDPDIFRVSNDENIGCTMVGRSGWHIDGTFLHKPFKFQTMHFPSVNQGGHTEFVPLNLLSDQLKPLINEDMEFLTDRRIHGVRHRLFTTHPITRENTMIFHCGLPFCAGWYSDGEYYAPENIIGKIENALKIDEFNIVYTMEWEKDDFAILDNLAVAHYAVPDTQKKDGLRILHRTTIKNDYDY